jgi:hypothetical protein
MGARIRGRTQLAVYYFSFEVDHHHRSWCQLVIRHAAWFDGKNPLAPVGGTHIPKSEKYQSKPGQLHIRFICFLPDLFVSHVVKEEG